MAIIDKNVIKGLTGNVVFKTYRGKQLVQAKPRYAPSSQTKETKGAAVTFGIASNLAMSIRDNLNRIVTDFFDGPMVNRLNSDVLYVLRRSINPETGIFNFTHDSFSRLNGFEFNENSPLRDNFFVQPTLNTEANLLQVCLPAMQIPQDLKFSHEAQTCLLSFGTGLYDLTYGRCNFNPIQSTEIQYSRNSLIIPEQQFDFEIEPGCLCITVISLQFIRKTFAGNMLLNTKKFNPVAILNAFIADGTVDEARTKNWHGMEFKSIVPKKKKK